MTQSKYQQLGGTITPEEIKALSDFVTEHELNIPRYEKAKATLDKAFAHYNQLVNEEDKG